MRLWRADIIAWIHFSIGTIALFVYSMIDSSVEQEVPRYVVPATLAAAPLPPAFALRDLAL